MRACGKCGELKVPLGGDWPYWKAGKPVCLTCRHAPEPTPPKPLTEEDVRRIVREEVLHMIETGKIWISEHRNP